jgi:hypothetical protein
MKVQAEVEERILILGASGMAQVVEALISNPSTAKK